MSAAQPLLELGEGAAAFALGKPGAPLPNHRNVLAALGSVSVGDRSAIAFPALGSIPLSRVLRDAASDGEVLPLGLAYWIVERLARILLTPSAEGKQVAHGALLPELVLLDSEGAVWLAGFEVGKAFTEGRLGLVEGGSCARFLGAEPHRLSAEKRDLRALAVLLLDLLSGVPVPSESLEPGLWRMAVAPGLDERRRAQLPSWVPLFDGALGARGTLDLPGFKDRVAKLAGELGEGPGTFQLAVFLDQAYGAELDLQRKAGVSLESTASGQHQDAQNQPAARPAAKMASGRGAAGPRSRRVRAWGLAAVLAVAATLGGLVWQQGRGRPEPAPLPPRSPSAAPQPTTPTSGQSLAEPPPPAAIDEAAQALVEQRAAIIEGELRAQYQPRLDALEDEIERKRRAQAETETAALQIASPTPAGAQTSDGTEPPASAGKDLASLEEPAANPAPEAPAAGVPTTAEGPAEPPSAPSSPTRVVPVAPGPGLTEPRLVELPRPTYPEAARQAGKRATVRVRVLVDEMGRVVETQPVGKSAGFGLDESALVAARGARFEPARRRDQPVAMWTTLKIQVPAIVWE